MHTHRSIYRPKDWDMQTKCPATSGPSNGVKAENFNIHEDAFDELRDLLTYECLITGKKRCPPFLGENDYSKRACKNLSCKNLSTFYTYICIYIVMLFVSHTFAFIFSSQNMLIHSLCHYQEPSLPTPIWRTIWCAQTSSYS